MKEKNTTKEKVLIYSLLFVLALLGLFYFLAVQPLLAETAQKRLQLTQVEAAASDYRALLAKLEPQKLTTAEKEKLTAAIPTRPSVDRFIEDLVQTEKTTNAVIDNLLFSKPSAEAEKQTADPEENPWHKLFPEHVYVQLEEEAEKVKNTAISYLDVQIDFHGKEAEINAFVEQLEKLPRIVHVQSYHYSRKGGEDSSLEGTVAARIFYGADFQAFVAADNGLTEASQTDKSEAE